MGCCWSRLWHSWCSVGPRLSAGPTRVPWQPGHLARPSDQSAYLQFLWCCSLDQHPWNTKTKCMVMYRQRAKTASHTLRSVTIDTPTLIQIHSYSLCLSNCWMCPSLNKSDRAGLQLRVYMTDAGFMPQLERMFSLSLYYTVTFIKLVV